MISKIKTLVLLGILTISNLTYAQKDSTKNNVFGGFIIMPIEFPVIETNALNQQLQNNGFPSAKYPTANLGIGIQIYGNRWITTFSFNKTTKTVENDASVTEVEYRSTAFNVGYSLTKSKWFSIYPYVGFKGSGLGYVYREKVPATSFDNYLQTNLNYKEVYNSKGHLDLGIGISHQWMYLINFRFGYLLSPAGISWNAKDQQKTFDNSPAISYNYYFSLTLGLGNIMSDNDLRNPYTRH